ncbi:MAG: glycosyltransferase family 4 protein [bacterium]
MRKILYFITQSEFGGAQRHIFDLADNLKNDFKIAVAFGQQGNNGKLAKILHENNIEYFIIPNLKRDISPVSDILALIAIIKLIKRHKPDIIHLNSSKISILGSMAAFITGTKAIYTVHGWVFNEPMPEWKKSFYKFAEKFTAKFKRKIICVSEYDYQTALKNKIAPMEKLAVIHNGIAPMEFHSKEKARQILNSQNSDLLIGSIGNLYKTKGFEYLVRAADILVNKNKIPAKFLIIGQGDEKEKIKNLIAEYNLENNFILAGQIDQAAKLLKAFDIYACSSVKEGLPYSILEAMNAGLPIVSTDVGGIPEMIKHEKTGLLAKPADAEDLAEKIKSLANNRILQIKLGENAKQSAGQNFGLKKMIEETKKIYQSSNLL